MNNPKENPMDTKTEKFPWMETRARLNSLASELAELSWGDQPIDPQRLRDLRLTVLEISERGTL